MHSQTTASGGLAGVVIDQSTAGVPDAAVGIKDVANGTTQSGKTDKEGVYQFPFLRPGTYTLRAMHPGFQGTLSMVIVAAALLPGCGSTAHIQEESA